MPGSALSAHEREEIRVGIDTEESLRSMARRLGRSPSTIAREVKRSGGRTRYRAATAERRADRMRARPKAFNVSANRALRDHVERRLVEKRALPAWMWVRWGERLFVVRPIAVAGPWSRSGQPQGRLAHSHCDWRHLRPRPVKGRPATRARPRLRRPLTGLSRGQRDVHRSLWPGPRPDTRRELPILQPGCLGSPTSMPRGPNLLPRTVSSPYRT